MYQLKVVPSLVATVIAIGTLCGPAYAKRKHPPKSTDAVPATEADSDSSTPATSAPPVAELPSTPPAEKPIAMAPPPDPEPPHSSPSRAEPPEADAKREAPERVRDSTGTQLSGHVGVGSPLVTLTASGSSRHVGSVNEDLTLVAPMGLGVALNDHWTFDFEFQVSTGVRPEGLTTAIIDPGVLRRWDPVTLGVRVAWQLNANQNIGLIPLMRLALLGDAHTNWFVEAALPAFVRNKQVTASASLQTGIAF